MQEIQILNFKNKMYEIIELVIDSRQPVLISDKEKVLVKIVPVAYPEQETWLGCMKGTGKIKGDIITSAEDTDAWKAISE